MLSNIQKSIIVRALEIRMAQGEEPEKVLESYSKLSESDKAEIMEMLGR